MSHDPSSTFKALDGKAAFVTGGSRGIGAAIVRRLAREGAAVAFTYARDQAAAADLQCGIESAGGRALALQVDSADALALTAAVDDAARSFGRLDILVNNAGVYLGGTIDSFSLEDLDRTLAVNVRAVFVASQAVARHMGAGSRIIMIGSCNADRQPAPGAAAYAMSKSALVGLVRGLARDLGPRQITVNNVQPGPVDTDMNPADGPRAGGMHALMALPRHGRADEIASMVAYLASAEAAFVTGTSVSVDGGYSA